MNYYSPTQTDIQLIRQKDKGIFIKIDLLDKNYKILDSIENKLISDNLTVDSESKQRRSYSCELQVTDKTYLFGEDRKIWIDKYIRVYYGIKNTRTREIHYYLLGTFSYSSVDYTYNATTNQLSLKCPDLMADYDGTKNGQIAGKELKIVVGQQIRDAVLVTLELAGITKYHVEDIGKDIPYDLEFSGTKTFCDVWTKLCELYDSWEFFFDVDGTFIWRKKPTGLHEPVIFDDNFLGKIWVTESTSYDFTQIYNKTEVWGKVLELQYEDRYTEDMSFAVENGIGIYTVKLPQIGNKEDYEEAEQTGNEYIVEYVKSLWEIDHLDQIGFKVTADSIGGDMVRFNDCPSIPIVNDDGSPIVAGRMKANQTYVFSFRRKFKDGNTENKAEDNIEQYLYLLGQYQCYGVYEEQSEECPFSIKNLGYEIINRVDYDQLYSDDLCYNQAEYLTYQSTALQDTVNLECLIIPWLDVSEKVMYTSKQSGDTNQYMIKNFSWSSLSGTMSITMYKFIESFEYVKNKS